MKTLSDFLQRFRSLVKDDSEIKSEIFKVINDLVGFEIKKDHISLDSKGNIFINCQPTVKSEIFFKKKIIIDTLNNKIKNQKFSDIFFN